MLPSALNRPPTPVTSAPGLRMSASVTFAGADNRAGLHGLNVARPRTDAACAPWPVAAPASLAAIREQTGAPWKLSRIT